MRIDGQLEGICPFGAKMALADRTLGIALNVDELAALAEDELPAADGAVRTDTLGDSGARSREAFARVCALNGSREILGRWVRGKRNMIPPLQRLPASDKLESPF